MCEKAKIYMNLYIYRMEEDMFHIRLWPNEKKSEDAEVIDMKAIDAENAQDLNILLKKAIDTYNLEYNLLKENGENLFHNKERAKELLLKVEDLVNSIANHPKKFDADIMEIQIQRKDFQNVCDYAEKELAAAKKSALDIGIGAAGGAAVASLAPSTAMWIATTFGTASTGTAISALSGAAATNAALAWLGGGALVAGGGGMAAGHAFLALAGPIGWGISGATLFASIVLFARKKAKLNREKANEIKAVLRNTQEFKELNLHIQALLKKIQLLYDGLNGQYTLCMSYYGMNFKKLRKSQQQQLGTLVNNAKALSMILGQTVER